MDYSDPNKIMDDMRGGPKNDYTAKPAKPTPQPSAQPQPAPQTPPTISIATQTATDYVPAGFWIRFLAAIIDGFIFGILSNIVLIPVMVVFGFIFGFEDVATGKNFMYTGISWTLSIAMSFCYHGWFNSKKGGTPGKMILQLKVVSASTGQNLTFAFGGLRDTVGKLISTMILMIGYIMAGVREDKRALHDLMFDSQVLQRVK